jgi:hypothetical protein
MSRALRAQRKGVVEQKRAVFHLRSYGDVSAEDLEWYAQQHQSEESDFKLLDGGTPVSAASPWPTPQQTKEN